MRRKTVIEYVAEHAEKAPDKIAVIEYGRTTTYGELFSMAKRYSQYLRNEGIKKGSIVVTKASQDLEYVVIYLGIHLSGGVTAAVEHTLSDDAMLLVAQQLGAAAIISSNVELDTRGIILLDRGRVLEVAADEQNEPEQLIFPALEDSADILFTTGTTGKSKGVELTHRALIATAENLIDGCQYKNDTVLIVPGPLNHANGIRKLFTTLVNGSTIHILNGMMNLKRFFDALENIDGSLACCLPPAAIRTIFQLTQDKLGQYADKIDFIETATSPLPEVDKQKLCKLLPRTRLYNNYGLSETASVCMYDYNKYPGRQNCVGKATRNSKILIVDDQKKPINSSKNNVGLLACAGDMNMKGYIREPALTSQVLVNGIVYTNDVGYIDADGFIYVTGRKGDVINIGGLKVAPTEVEAATLEYPGIIDCICIPVEDSISEKALKLLMVLKEEQNYSPIEIRKFLATKLESYKVPHYYERVATIARTYNGKLDRMAYTQK